MSSCCFASLVASAALLLIVARRRRSQAQRHDARAVARSGADVAARHGRFHGADVRGTEAHGRGRCRHHHGHVAGRGCGCSAWRSRATGFRAGSLSAVALGGRGACAGAGDRSRAGDILAGRQPAGRRRGAVRGELRAARQAAGAALPAAAAGARRQPRGTGAVHAAGPCELPGFDAAIGAGSACGCWARGTRWPPA